MLARAFEVARLSIAQLAEHWALLPEVVGFPLCSGILFSAGLVWICTLRVIPDSRNIVVSSYVLMHVAWQTKPFQISHFRCCHRKPFDFLHFSLSWDNAGIVEYI